jgi:hypothetical protein
VTASRISAVHRALGDAFLLLPVEVQRTHDNGGSLRLSGFASADGPSGLLPRVICWAVGLPRAGANQPVIIDFATDENGVDHWVRNFNGRIYESRLSAVASEREGKLIEHMGIFKTVFRLTAAEDRLTFDIEEMTIFGMQVPKFLAIDCHAFESGKAGGFAFDIAIELGVIGRLIHYYGILR